LLKAERNLKYTQITSPINGTIHKIKIQSGQLSNNDYKVKKEITVVNTKKLVIKAKIDPSIINQMKLDQLDKIQIKANNRTFTPYKVITSTKADKKSAEINLLFYFDNNGKMIPEGTLGEIKHLETKELKN